MHDGHSDAGDEVPDEEAGPVGPHPAEDRDVSEQELQPLLLAARRLQGALQRLRWDHQLPQLFPNRDFGRLEPLLKLGLSRRMSMGFSCESVQVVVMVEGAEDHLGWGETLLLLFLYYACMVNRV